jgi:quercetin 2,3-dioxygenase
MDRYPFALRPRGSSLDPEGRVKEIAESPSQRLILFDSGDEVIVQAGDERIRFLLVSGKPLQEPHSV